MATTGLMDAGRRYSLPDLYRTADLTDLQVDWNDDGYRSEDSSLARDMQALALTDGADVASNPNQISLSSARGVAVLTNRDFRYNQEGAGAFDPDAQSRIHRARLISRASDTLIWEGVALPAEHTHRPGTVDTASIRLQGALYDELNSPASFFAIRDYDHGEGILDVAARSDIQVATSMANAWDLFRELNTLSKGVSYINDVPFSAMITDNDTVRSFARKLASFVDGWPYETHDGTLAMLCPRARAESPVGARASLRLTESPFIIFNDSYIEESVGLVRNRLEINRSRIVDRTSAPKYDVRVVPAGNRSQAKIDFRSLSQLDPTIPEIGIVGGSFGEIRISSVIINAINADNEDFDPSVRLEDSEGIINFEFDDVSGDLVAWDTGQITDAMPERNYTTIGFQLKGVEFILTGDNTTRRISSSWSRNRYGPRNEVLPEWSVHESDRELFGIDTYQYEVWHRRHLNRVKVPPHYARVRMPLAQPDENLSAQVANIHQGDLVDVEVIEPANNGSLLRRPMVVLQRDFDIRPGRAIPSVLFHCIELPESYESERYVARTGVARAGRNTVAYASL